MLTSVLFGNTAPKIKESFVEGICRDCKNFECKERGFCLKYRMYTDKDKSCKSFTEKK